MSIVGGSMTIPMMSNGICGTGFACPASNLAAASLSSTSTTGLGLVLNCNYADASVCTFSTVSGGYASGDTTKCPGQAQCKDCSVAGKCKCPGQSTPISGTQFCTLTCGSGYFLYTPNPTCVPCEVTLLNLGVLGLLNLGISLGNHCTATSCAAGQYLSAGRCFACATGAISLGGTTATCTPCVSPLVPSTDKSKCVLQASGLKKKRQTVNHISRHDSWR